MLQLVLKKNEEKRIRAGHPWIFSNELTKIEKCVPGELVDVYDYRHQFIGRGYYNPHSLIAVRLLTRVQTEEINAVFFKKKLLAAIEYRQQIYPHENSYRVVYSEADGIPGLIIDKYEHCLVMQILTAGMEVWQQTIIDLLIELYQPNCIYLRNDSPFRTLEGLSLESKLIYGTVPDPLIIQQDGLKFKVDIAHGQKTGFFFDHRDNRKSITSFIAGKTVLDAFCGTGVWSIYAAKFGARSVLGIDSSESALAIAQENAALNEVTKLCQFQIGETFETLKRLENEKRQFDCVILDPPAFAKSRTHIPTAIKGYRELNQRAIRLLPTGGYLVTASCSHHISRERFFEMLKSAAEKEKVFLRLIRFGQQALDHPILLTIPETEYLKCVTVQIIR
ncbi:MAG: class I SAM-dependent rRNA methyltransferase [bacterium]|nr:class I SAM-dependent rRNA methyltransferase [bacterium]